MSEESTSDDVDITTRVVERVAEKEGVDATDLTQPLDQVVNPDAINALFSTRGDGTARSCGTIQFTYLGYEIVIDSEHNISIEEQGD